MTHKQTPSQTIGPFFAYGLTPEQYGYDFDSVAIPEVAGANSRGQRIVIRGQVFDGEGRSVNDAMLEFWQANDKGDYNKENVEPHSMDFKGYGRVGTGSDERNEFAIHTIKPGNYKKQAPHINVTLFARGLLNHQFTRIYFADCVEENEQDRVLNLIPKSRRQTLIAKVIKRSDVVEYRFDLHLQGNKETVFFDL